MRRLFILIFVLFITVMPVWAQSPAPDYTVENIRSEFSPEGTQIVVLFEVHNIGSDATEAATVLLTVLESGQLIENFDLPALNADASVTLRFTFNATAFPTDSLQTLQASIELDEENQDARSNNTAFLCVTFTQNTTSVVGQCINASENPIGFIFRQLNIDPNDTEQVLRVVGVGAAVLLLMMIVWITVRAATQKTPAFGAGRPPYATMGQVDTNSIWGRRQLWQQHAQNDALPASGVEGSVYARKLMLGVDNIYLSGWRIMAIRISQYDAYGRVAHTQVLASDGMVKRLNRAVRSSLSLSRNIKLNNEQKRQRLSRQVSPIARNLAGKFQGKINNRNAMLPVALDIRLEGTHGEVRIVFELFQCQYGVWQQIDGWEPEMMVTGKTIYETYTFTVFGQLTSESFRDFKRRLPVDITRFLVDAVTLSAPDQPELSGPPAPEQSASDTPTQGGSGVDPVEV
jgi:hypothetical protein